MPDTNILSKYARKRAKRLAESREITTEETQIVSTLVEDAHTEICLETIINNRHGRVVRVSGKAWYKGTTPYYVVHRWNDTTMKSSTVVGYYFDLENAEIQLLFPPVESATMPINAKFTSFDVTINDLPVEVFCSDDEGKFLVEEIRVNTKEKGPIDIMEILDPKWIDFIEDKIRDEEAGI